MLMPSKSESVFANGNGLVRLVSSADRGIAPVGVAHRTRKTQGIMRLQSNAVVPREGWHLRWLSIGGLEWSTGEDEVDCGLGATSRARDDGGGKIRARRKGTGRAVAACMRLILGEIRLKTNEQRRNEPRRLNKTKPSYKWKRSSPGPFPGVWYRPFSSDGAASRMWSRVGVGLPKSHAIGFPFATLRVPFFSARIKY